MNELVNLLAFIVGGILLLILFVGFVMWAMEFRRELEYVKMEINRTEGEEKKYWKRRKREMWLSLLPFYR